MNLSKKILAFNVKGILELGEEFSLNFICEDNKTLIDKEEELIKVFKNNENIYLNKLNFIFGKNASGKTTILKLITFIKTLSEWGEENGSNIKFNLYNTINKKIEIESFYAIGDNIFKQKISFKLHKDDHSIEDSFYLEILKEEVSISKNIHKNISKKEVLLWFKDVISWRENSEVLFSNTRDVMNIIENNNSFKLNWNKIPRFHSVVKQFILQKSIIEMESSNFIKKSNEIILEIERQLSEGPLGFISLGLPDTQSIINIIEKEIEYLKFIEVFDPLIESIKWNKLENKYWIKFKHRLDTIKTSEIHHLISAGTLKGMVLVSIIKNIIDEGLDFYIDEIETHLNAKIVQYIINLFLDKEINTKGSRLFTTTHFTATLNMSNRRDSIYLIDRNDKAVTTVKKLSGVGEIQNNKIRKKDIKNSSLVKNIWSVDLNPGKKEYLELKNIYGRKDKFKN